MADPAPRAAPEEVLAGVAEVVHLVTARPTADVMPERLFVDELGVDSLAMIEVLEGVAQRFGIRIDDEDVRGFVRVRDLTDYVAVRR